jgi:hypothetical protein
MWGVRGGREHPPLTHIQSNACRFLFLLFIYLRLAEAASFDKKSYAGAIQQVSFLCEFAQIFRETDNFSYLSAVELSEYKILSKVEKLLAPKFSEAQALKSRHFESNITQWELE